MRPARRVAADEVLTTGKYRFRMLSTPHVPHGWDASMLFEETRQTLFCSDLFYQSGDVEARTEADVVGRFREGLIKDQQGPFAQVYPYTAHTDASLDRLAALVPKTLAIMHGSASNVTLKSIANNPEIDEIYARMHPAIDAALAELSRVRIAHRTADGARSAPYEIREWEVPFHFPDDWPEAARKPFDAFHAARQAMQKQMDASIAAHADGVIPLGRSRRGRYSVAGRG